MKESLRFGFYKQKCWKVFSLDVLIKSLKEQQSLYDVIFLFNNNTKERKAE